MKKLIPLILALLASQVVCAAVNPFRSDPYLDSGCYRLFYDVQYEELGGIERNGYAARKHVRKGEAQQMVSEWVKDLDRNLDLQDVDIDAPISDVILNKEKRFFGIPLSSRKQAIAKRLAVINARMTDQDIAVFSDAAQAKDVVRSLLNQQDENQRNFKTSFWSDMRTYFVTGLFLGAAYIKDKVSGWVFVTTGMYVGVREGIRSYFLYNDRYSTRDVLQAALNSIEKKPGNGEKFYLGIDERDSNKRNLGRSVDLLIENSRVPRISIIMRDPPIDVAEDHF